MNPDLVLNGDQKLFRFRKLLKSKKRNQKRLIKEQKKTISAAVKAKLRAKYKASALTTTTDESLSSDATTSAMPSTSTSTSTSATTSTKPKSRKSRKGKAEKPRLSTAKPENGPRQAKKKKRTSGGQILLEYQDESNSRFGDIFETLAPKPPEKSGQSATGGFPDQPPSGKVCVLSVNTTGHLPVLPDLDLDLDDFLFSNIFRTAQAESRTLAQTSSTSTLSLSSSSSSTMAEFYQSGSSSCMSEILIPAGCENVSDSFVTLDNVFSAPPSTSLSLSDELDELFGCLPAIPAAVIAADQRQVVLQQRQQQQPQVHQQKSPIPSQGSSVLESNPGPEARKAEKQDGEHDGKVTN